jgi:hypothetical protein
MPSLRDTQGAFAAALAGADGSAAGRYILGGTLPVAERIAIYANNSWMAFRNALELSYPAVARLGGPEWFSSVARRYRTRHPSRSGNLQYVGADFPAFLAAELADTSYAVVADVAALEWAYQEVLVAPDARPFDAAMLATVPAAAYAQLRFPLAATCRLVSSRWPILAIWQANRDETAPVPVIDLDAGGDRLLLQRTRLEVELRRLEAGEWAFLEALAAGLSLGTAGDRAAAVQPAFDFGLALGRHVRLGVLATAVLPAPVIRPEESHEPA